MHIRAQHRVHGGALNYAEFGYDHSYFFMATFVADHIAFHAALLA